MLKDNYLRTHNYLRVSVTDKCNLRCRYCMPPQGVTFMPHDEVLRNEEFTRLIDIFVRMGIKKIRFTGGEPLIRKGFFDIISETVRMHPETDLCVTTNGTLLEEHIPDLKKYNVKKLNISLDTMSREKFHSLTGVDHFNTVINNIERSLSADFFDVKVNGVLLKSTLDEIDEFLEYFADKNITLRFIERMPVTEQDEFNEFIPSDELIRILGEKGKLTRKNIDDTDVSLRYDLKYKNGNIRIGIIPPVTHRFCATCSRLRITADGNLKTCLHSDRQYNLKDLLRNDADESVIVQHIVSAIKEKGEGHNIKCTADNTGCRSITAGIKSMSSIGG
ncbi:MAG TPA: GTP 3',8-cyclase MoaA [Spirochaetota bacterium]|nr:GTP 3',8-cyclase MoaA [Spirochaetota bacterium]HPS88214.1 GTP 3',8-cyclase MoaA [Spirochaetota bacterium]